MSYINFEYLEEQKIQPLEYIALQACKQMRYEDVSAYLIEICTDEEFLLKLEDRGLVTFVKEGAKKNLFQRARVSSAGKKILESSEVPGILDEDIKIWDWLAETYRKLNKEIGNAAQGKRWLAAFRVHSGINKNYLAKLCTDFINDDTKMEYSFRLEYVFYKPSNQVAVPKFELEGSKLWQFYISRKEYFDAKFKQMQENGK